MFFGIPIHYIGILIIALAVVLLVFKKLKQTIYLVLFGLFVYAILNWSLLFKWFTTAGDMLRSVFR